MSLSAIAASTVTASAGPPAVAAACAMIPARSTLTSVAATSGTDAWAVGFYDAPTATNPAFTKTLIEHWDGARWCMAQSASPGAEGSGLTSVTAVSVNDAWAVGTSTGQPGSGFSTLIEHWDGKAWSQVTSPNPSSKFQDNFLTGVAAQSSNSVWAVGAYTPSSGGEQPLILRWRGAKWKQVASPSPVQVTALDSVAALPHSAFAVGNASQQAFALRWNGSAWVQPGSPLEPRGAGLDGSAFASASNGWAVGFQQHRTAILKWNGTAWSDVPSPARAATGSLSSVAVRSATSAWAVGNTAETDSGNSTIIVRWNGKSWSKVASPNPGGARSENTLSGVAVTSATNAWAVGQWDKGASVGPIILRWNGSVWKTAPIG